MKSFWNKWLTDIGNIRVVSLEGTALMHELCAQQTLDGLGQQGYADAVIGSLLIASAHKSNESINMNAQGSGPFRQAIIDASPEGRVRGFLIEQKDASMHTFGEHGTNGPWGSGILSILYTKNFEGKMPYTGMVPISTGFLDDAINDYFRDSEQLVSKVGLHVESSGREILAARGALVQALGGASDQELDTIRALTLIQMRDLARDAGDPEKFEAKARSLIGGGTLKKVEERDLEAFCNCSQERIERAFKLTGERDIVEALGQDQFLSVTCDFCRKEYRVSAERIKALFTPDPSRLQ
jgi:molecular chaperone Hsp33